MDDLAKRVLARWAKTKEIPVKNKDTGRTVYVLPETLKKDPGRFEKVRPETVGDPRWRGKAKPPRRPKKPDRPEIPRDTPPAPVKPPVPPKRVKPPKKVKPVPLLKGPKVPEPSPFRRWKKVKRFLSAESQTMEDSAAARVAARFLEATKIYHEGDGLSEETMSKTPHVIVTSQLYLLEDGSMWLWNGPSARVPANVEFRGLEWRCSTGANAKGAHDFKKGSPQVGPHSRW